MEQQIRFCTTSDGARLVYATVGQGPPLVWPPPWVSHLEFMFEEPACRAFFDKLARHHTLVRYDKRGCGLSDRDRTDFSLEADLRDLEDVINHLGLERFALFGQSQAGPVAVAYAAKHPQRLTHLIIYGAYVRGGAISKPEIHELLLSLVRSHWGVGSKTLAGSGEILVSSTVKNLVAGSDISFEDKGAHPLKGIPGDWRLFAVQRSSNQ